jgi:DUF177 domain-containing protein
MGAWFALTRETHAPIVRPPFRPAMATNANPLHITLEQIPEEGLELNEPIGVELLAEALADENQETGFHATAPSRLKAHLRKVSGGVLLDGKLKVQVAASCKRCLVEVKATLPVSFTLNLVPRTKVASAEGDEAEDGKGERAGSFDLEDADEEAFDGKTIDLDPILREQVLLALPMDVVCKDDCKGLCPMCGQNLNEKQCGCES